MDISSVISTFWRRKWIIIITTLVAVGVVMLRTAELTPVYRSSAVLRVATTAIGSVDFLQYDLTYTDRLMNTYTHLATTTPVLDELADRLGSPAELNVSVEPIEDTELLVVSAEHPDPLVARNAAAALADILIDRIRQAGSGRDDSALQILRQQLSEVEADLEEARADFTQLASLYADTDERVTVANRTLMLTEQIYATLLDQYEKARIGEVIRADQLSLVEPASLPDKPSSPNVPLNLGLAAMIGLAVGIALAAVFENNDSTLHTSQAIADAVDVDVLGQIPVNRGPRIHTFANGGSPQEEAYRSLRSTLFSLNNEHGLKSIVFTSTMRNEGKSTIVANLARAIAQSGRKVIAVDADLRRPTLSTLLGASSEVGLVQLLRKDVEPWEALTHTEHPNLKLITTGSPLPPNPSEFLTAMPVAEVLDVLLREADLVLIDAPALGPVADAAVIAPIADATVLVVGRGRVKEEAVQAAYRRLLQAKARNLSVVINRAERAPSYA